MNMPGFTAEAVFESKNRTQYAQRYDDHSVESTDRGRMLLPQQQLNEDCFLDCLDSSPAGIAFCYTNCLDSAEYICNRDCYNECTMYGLDTPANCNTACHLGCYEATSRQFRSPYLGGVLQR
jgi:hypothetical protein